MNIDKNRVEMIANNSSSGYEFLNDLYIKDVIENIKTNYNLENYKLIINLLAKITKITNKKFNIKDTGNVLKTIFLPLILPLETNADIAIGNPSEVIVISKL